MIKAHFIVFLLISLTTLFACNRTEFNKEKWSGGRDDIGSPSIYRKQMLHDLVANHELIGLKYGELINQLGKSDRMEDRKVYYNIIVEYGFDIDPVYTKDLVFNLSADTVVKSFTVTEWETN